MKILVGASAGWIGFVLADRALFDGRTVLVLSRFGRDVAAGFGFFF
jgi:nucleoside-diphosphate-sugar epimerase